jgi:homoserine dehydrogenase
VTAADVYREGIRDITASDIAAAKTLGCTVKLLALCERVVAEDGTERVSARVHPAMVPRNHPLASVDGAYNAVVVEGEAAGRLMFYGQGAGGAPTASAVLGDLVAVSRNLVHGGRGPRESAYADLGIAPMGETPTRYHVSMEVADRAGVLAAVAGEFAKRGVSISVVRQVGRDDGASLVVVTHTARDSALADTVAALRDSEFVNAVTSVLRVEGGTP